MWDLINGNSPTCPKVGWSHCHSENLSCSPSSHIYVIEISDRKKSTMHFITVEKCIVD